MAVAKGRFSGQRGHNMVEVELNPVFDGFSRKIGDLVFYILRYTNMKN